MYSITILLCCALMLIKSALTEIVPCDLQKEVCECNIEATDCEFTLVIERIQTFTSYEIHDSSLVTTAVSGEPYYLDSSGAYVSVRDPKFPCALGTVTEEQHFRDANCSIPMMVDGETYRTVVAVNGRIPGPTLIVTENQTVVVNVVNKLRNEVVSIHWHGLYQKNTPWMDGVSYVSQRPIGPGGTFRYIFKAYPYGSYWYHSHVTNQRSDGLFGDLIIREPNEVVEQVKNALGDNLAHFMDIPAHHSISLLDWDQESSSDRFARFHANGIFNRESIIKPNTDTKLLSTTRSSDGASIAETSYWSGLINGRGRYSLNDAITPSLLSNFEVESGNVYRFRLLGAQRLFAYKFSIDQHKLIVIASDGSFIEPVEVDYIILNSGERYDFLLQATGSGANYWMRAETLESNGEGGFLGNSAEAILHYSGRTNPSPSENYANIVSAPQTCSSTTPCKALNCPFLEFPVAYAIECVQFSSLRTLLPTADADLPSLNLNENCNDCLRFFYFFDTEGSAINGRNLRLPPIAYQTNPGQFERDTENGRNCQGCWVRFDNTSTPRCMCTHVTTIASQGNVESVRLVLIGNRNFAHPVHLHGHKFIVVHMQFGEYKDGVLTGTAADRDIICDDHLCSNPRWKAGPPDLRNYSIDGVKLSNRLILKDTIIVPAGAYLIVSIIANNPGYWLLHCHVENHQTEGMAVIIQEFPETFHNPPPVGINTDIFQWTLEDFNDKFSDNRLQPLPHTCILTRWYYTLLFFFALSFALMIILCIGILYCCVRLIYTRKEIGRDKLQTEDELPLTEQQVE